VWGEFLKRFRTPTGPAPKKLADYQYYMQHEDFKQKITAEFDTRKDGVPAKEHLNLRATIARELFAAEPQEIRMQIKEEATAEHASLIDKNKDTLEGLPSLDEEDVTE
jgi:hypothetical protein